MDNEHRSTAAELEARWLSMVRVAESDDPAERITAVREADLAGEDREELLVDVQIARRWIRGMDAQIQCLQESLASMQLENAALRRRLDGGRAA